MIMNMFSREFSSSEGWCSSVFSSREIRTSQLFLGVKFRAFYIFTPGNVSVVSSATVPRHWLDWRSRESRALNLRCQ
eukprot:g14124.t1